MTPFLLEVTGVDSYTVVAIGQSIHAGVAGVHSVGFSAVEGSATTVAGHSYTFGYQNMAYESDGGGGLSQVAGSANSGSIPFDGYNIFSDTWSYATTGDLRVGLVFGAGGIGLDTSGFAGRIYSANVTFDAVPAPASLVLLAAGLTACGRRRR